MSQTKILESNSSVAIPVATALLGLSLAGRDATAIELKSPETGLSIQLDPQSGAYQVTRTDVAWMCAGSFGLPLTHARTSRGSDSLGHYQEVSFQWRTNDAPMSGQIKLYTEKPLALFSQTCGAAMTHPPSAFPAFTRMPEKLHIFSHELHEFAPPKFAANEISTPWLLFDDQANAVIISPASHFMVASMSGNGRDRVASGFNPNLRNLPEGFTHSSIMAFGKGINRTWESWGRALIDLQQAKRPANDADTVLKYLGYWTDNGAYYYYNYNADQGYIGTLLGLADYFKREKMPIRYLQLDSWWYYKSTTDADGKAGKAKKIEKLPEGEWNRYGGTLEYTAHTNLFTNGLAAFRDTVGLPLVTHARWIDPSSPYHQAYKGTGLAMTDPKWWDKIAGYLKTSGVVTYEQDWLDRIYNFSPAFSADPNAAQAFLDQMARGCGEKGITLQYCMPFAAHFMQGCRYENLTTIRTSGDRFNTNRWNDFLYVSRLASALGIWPWADVYKSDETGNVLLSTLSAGPVGIGDAIDTATMTNLCQSVRTDGVIVKPDAPIVPLDRCYIADANDQPEPLTSGTFTRHGAIQTGYIFAFNRPKTPLAEFRFTSADVGVTGPAYVYNYFEKSGKLLNAGSAFTGRVKKGSLAYFTIAPIGKSGIAFLGDSGKFVGTGKQRIAAIKEDSAGLTAKVTLAESEPVVTLQGYATALPNVKVESGTAGTVNYDAATGLFSFELRPDAKAHLDHASGDPVRQISVTMTVPKKS